MDWFEDYDDFGGFPGFGDTPSDDVDDMSWGGTTKGKSAAAESRENEARLAFEEMRGATELSAVQTVVVPLLDPRC